MFELYRRAGMDVRKRFAVLDNITQLLIFYVIISINMT